MPHRLITHTEDLEAFCRKYHDVPYMTVDTEFLREKTYYPLLCVIQLAAPAPAPPIAIDPLSEELNLTPLESIFFNPDIVKVFHAPRQDLEILLDLFDGRLPAPLFDTQVAAMVTGYGDQIGYQALVKNICNADIDKSRQFTDWSRRPLTTEQVDYALSDVTYLRDIYLHMKEILDQQNRWSWMAEEMEVLHNPETHRTDPDRVWEKIKIRSDKPKVLAALQALAAWRERMAQERNKPRHFILRDEILSEIARQMPKSEDDLNHIRGLPERYRSGKDARTLLNLVAEAQKKPKSDCPQRIQRAPFPQEKLPALEMLKMLLRIKAAEHGVVARLLATQDDLESLLLNDSPDLQIMQGWRGKVFGNDAKALINGEISLTLQQGEVRILSRSAA